MSDTLNPYESQAGGPEPAADWSQLGEMEYWEAVRFVWQNPNWVANLLMASLCMFAASVIPVLPQLVLIGYQCEVMESLILRPRMTYPDFKFDRLAEYLTRGLWPFLVALLVGIATVPLILLVSAVPIIAIIVLANAMGDNAELGIVLLGLMLFVLIFVMGICCNVTMVPFLLRAALTQDLGASLDLAFARDFVRRMWKETLTAGLFMMLVGFVAQLVGLVLCFVGIFLTFPILQFAQAHLAAQLYRVYLARGGEMIPMKAPSAN